MHKHGESFGISAIDSKLLWLSLLIIHTLHVYYVITFVDYISEHYNAENLIGKSVMAVVNFPKKQVANFMSEVLVLGFADDLGKIVLAVPDADVPIGTRLS